MNPTDYTFLLSHPEAVNERQTDALEKIITEFPYFQSARALRLKGLYNQNSFQYNYALKVTAAYTTDRSVLFDFITSDSFTAIQRGLYEQKLAEIEGITVKDSHHVSEEDKTERPTDIELTKQSILTSIREAETRDTGAVETFESLQNTPATVEEVINPEDFGPLTEEPQFLPEAIAPVEFTHIETEVIPETSEIEAEEQEIAQPDEIDIVAKIQTENFIVDEPVFERVDSAEPTETTVVETSVVETSAESEAKLGIGQPLTFAKNETHSFAEWLQLTKLQPIVRDENEPAAPGQEESAEPAAVERVEIPDKISKDELIDRFIETNPKMSKVKADAPPVAIEPREDTSSLMTETLARVYLEQRKYQKAIQAYEILILKYPEKSSFFADRISEIKNLQQNNIL